MVQFEQGNLLEANAEALVNTVNTVGVMGKGIALMFKERFPENFKAYAAACKQGDVRLGEMFVTENIELGGPRWIVNFPTKDHWRSRTRLEWIEWGMEDLGRVIEAHGIRSISGPAAGLRERRTGLARREAGDRIGAGAHGMARGDRVRADGEIPEHRQEAGVEELTPARAMVAEMVRRYCLLGLGCSVLEVQKLAWFIGRGAEQTGVEDPLELEFQANVYGPYSDNLRLLLDALDGSYLGSERRLADARPASEIWFNAEKKDFVEAYMRSPGKRYLPALAWATDTIRGFESPLGMEVLSTVDWLLQRGGRAATADDVWDGIRHWGRGQQRKARIFDDRLVDFALKRLATRRNGCGP